MPDTFFDLPEIWPELQYVWEAFGELSTERGVGMGPGPIPASRIRAYGERQLGYDPDGEAIEDFVFLIREMDTEDLGNTLKKIKGGDKGKKGEPENIPADDTEGVRNLMRSFMTARAKKK